MALRWRCWERYGEDDGLSTRSRGTQLEWSREDFVINRMSLDHLCIARGVVPIAFPYPASIHNLRIA